MFRIRAENFLSFKHLEFDFSNRGLVLIEGQNKDESLYKSNGAGKTNLVDCLCWGLYGESQKVKSPDKVVNIASGHDCEVEVAWDKYKVIRYRKHHKFKNDVQIFENGEDRTPKSNADTQAYIEKILGLSYNSFVKSIYFQQNVLNSFATAKDSEQKAIIEDILNLHLISEAQEIAKQKFKNLQLRLDKHLSEQTYLSLNVGNSEAHIKQLQIKASSWSDAILLEVADLENQIKQLESKATYVSDFDMETARNMIAASEPLQTDIKKLELSSREIETKKQAALNAEQGIKWQLKTLEERQFNQIAEVEKLQNIPNPKCPTCGKEMGIATTQKLIKEYENKVELTRQQLVELKTKAVVSTSSEYDAQINDMRSQVESKRKIWDLAQQLRNKLLQEEYKAKEASLVADRIAEIEKRVVEVKNRENPYIISLTVEESQLAITRQKLDESNASISGLRIEQSYYDYWVEGLANNKLKSYIMDSIIPFINERANHYALFLTGGAFTIDISTQTKLKSGELRDKFAVNILSNSGADYELSSGGERKRIDVCILLALQDLVGSRANQPLQLLIIDEVSENLDDVGTERMLELLNNITKQKGSCFYITHQEGMKPLFPNVVTVVKEHGISKVVNE
jgi:DNA repair exonuclease SbcCD ATPase subunit